MGRRHVPGRTQPTASVSAVIARPTQEVERLFSQAQALQQAGHLSQAVQILQRVLALDRGNVSALTVCGTLFLQMGQLESGIQLLGLSLELHPNQFEVLNNRGIALRELGRRDEALASFDQAVALAGERPEIHVNRGMVLRDLKRYEAAFDAYAKALVIDPMCVAAYGNQGNLFLDLGRFEEACVAYDKALSLQPANPTILYHRGLALSAQEKFAAALGSYEQAIRYKPTYAEAWLQSGNALVKMNNSAAALRCFDAAIAAKPGLVEAHLRRGAICRSESRFAESLLSVERVLEISPDNIDALLEKMLVLRELGRHVEALACGEKAHAIRPSEFSPRFVAGLVLQDLGRHQEALALFDHLITLRPEVSQLYDRKGVSLLHLRREREALDCFDRAIGLDPNFSEAHHNRGTVLRDLKQTRAALASLGRAIDLNPQLAEAYNSRGAVLRDLGNMTDAMANYTSAISINPRLVMAYLNRAGLSRQLGALERAAKDYEHALAIAPDTPYVLGDWAYCMMALCRWAELPQAIRRIHEAIAHGQDPILPFLMITLPTTAAEQLQVATRHSQREYSQSIELPLRNLSNVGRRIRIGYFSADFHNHATAHLLAGVLESHDRNQFEVIAFSYGPAKDDLWRRRIEQAVDRFEEVAALTDQDIAKRARDLEVDIAVDLKGHTDNARTGIFMFRPAPIQVNYLGYPGTMGAEFIDYIVADKTVLPEDHRQHYSEKVVYLPHSYQANDSKKVISPIVPGRAELGLPEKGFVFCCFNNSYKIEPQVFDIWMRLLGRVEGSVLWLLQSNDVAVANLRREAEARGIAGERLVFSPAIELSLHLARLQQADLFLDTFSCNAHTTASDALWAGLPVLTRLGETFASRVAASLLTAAGVPALITRSAEDYEALALVLATEPTRLSEIHERLMRQRSVCPLFDTTGFTHDLEAAYSRMMAIFHQGLAPQQITIE